VCVQDGLQLGHALSVFIHSSQHIAAFHSISQHFMPFLQKSLLSSGLSRGLRTAGPPPACRAAGSKGGCPPTHVQGLDWVGLYA
jgi:hypothetical protein